MCLHATNAINAINVNFSQLAMPNYMREGMPNIPEQSLIIRGCS